MVNVCFYWVVTDRGFGELGPICSLSDLTPNPPGRSPAARSLRSVGPTIKATADVMTGAVAYCFP